MSIGSIVKHKREGSKTLYIITHETWEHWIAEAIGKRNDKLHIPKDKALFEREYQVIA